MPPTTCWRYTWRTSRLVRACTAIAGGLFAGLVLAAVLARVVTRPNWPSLVVASAVATGLGVVVTARASVRGDDVVLGAAGSVLTVAVPTGLGLYALALAGNAAAALGLFGLVESALAAGALATVFRTSGSVDLETSTLRYGRRDRSVAVDLSRVVRTRTVSLHRRAILWFTYEDDAKRPFDPSTPRFVIVSTEAARLVGRITHRDDR